MFHQETKLSYPSVNLTITIIKQYDFQEVSDTKR